MPNFSVDLSFSIRDMLFVEAADQAEAVDKALDEMAGQYDIPRWWINVDAVFED